MKTTKKQGSKLISMTLAAAMLVAPMPAMAASSDIRGHWAEDVIYEWEESGMISGYKDGTFRPNKPITRAEFSRILNQALDLKTKGSVSFSDVTSSKWYYDDVAIAVGEKYTAGFPDNTFRPNATITRAEAAVFVSKVAVLSGGSMGYFSDASSIPAWARSSVGAMVENGYMSGYKNGSFQPNGSLTRAEAVSTLNRVMTNGLDEEAIREKDRVITKDGTKLKNETIAGNLIISRDVGEGEVHLEKVKVQGDLIIRGGGENSVYLKDTTVEGNTIMDKEDVRVEISGKTTLPRIEIWRTCNLQGEEFKGKISKILITDRITDFITMNIPAKSLVMQEKANVEIKQPIDSIEVTRAGAGSKIEVDKNITVPLVVADGKVALSGKGTVTLLEANVGGSTYTDSITVKETETPKDVKPPLNADEIYVDRIRVKGTDGVSSISVKGGTLQMIAEVSPSDAKNKEVTWSVKDRSGKATISASGLLTAVENGNVTVKATAKDANEAYGEMDIKISNQIDGVVSTRAIAGVTPPVRGAVPVTTIAETPEYTGAVTWTPAVAAGGVFAPETVYTANVTLTPKAGYTFTGVAENYFSVAGGAATNAVNSGAVKVVFPVTGKGDVIIQNRKIQGVTIPVKDAVPVSELPETLEYTATITWEGDPEIFEVNKAYIATINLAPKAGYTLTGVTANSFEVAGATTVNAANSGVITATFVKVNLPITKAEIDGVVPPKIGKRPTANLTGNDQYNATISWKKDHEFFMGGETYVATITVTPKTGYTLDGVSENFFSAGGVKGTNAEGSGVVTVAFPTLGAGDVVINKKAITGIVPPVRGAEPVTDDLDRDQYTAKVAWLPAATTFLPGTEYTAKITLTPKAGFTLNGVTENFFTVSGAETTYVANGDEVLAKFPATKVADIIIENASLTGIEPPKLGEKPVIKVESKPEYKATMTWRGNPTEFLGGTVYYADVVVTPADGYALAKNAFTVPNATVTNEAGSGIVTVAFDQTEPTPVKPSPVVGVVAPVKGATPVRTLPEGLGYTAAITWEVNGELFTGTMFAGDTEYKANICITAKQGFTLDGVDMSKFTVAGGTVAVQTNGELQVSFPSKTAKGTIPVQSNVLSGISIPTVGGRPTENAPKGKTARSTGSTFGDFPQYTATIFWNGNPNRFEANMIYSARIEIKAKKGYSLSGISKDYFQVPGAKSVKTIKGNATSCVVEVVFPVTGE